MRALLLVAVCLAVSGSAHSAPPLHVNFQGLLLDASGTPLPGPVPIRIEIYPQEVDGEFLYAEDHPNVALTDGVFDILIGTGEEFLGDLEAALDGRPAWLQVQINDEVLSPRRPFTPVPHAFRAGDADSVGNIPAAQVVTDGNLEARFLLVVSRVSDSQIPETIARDGEIKDAVEVEMAERAEGDAALLARIALLEQRLAAIEGCACAPITLHGLKWLDQNADTARDPGEPGLAGVTVYVDLNRNDVLDDGEPLAVTMPDDPDTQIDETGRYWLESVPPGTHVVREIVPAGFIQTAPAAIDFHTVVVQPGDLVDGLDFGNFRVPVGSVHGTKWNDLNANGQRDGGEPGLPGVVIYVDVDRDGKFDPGEPSTVSMIDDPNTSFDEAGLYWLNDLLEGAYVIREVVPDGFEQTFPPLGMHLVVLGPGEIVDGLDFGNFSAPPGAVHGLKWNDLNTNGQRDPGEPGLAGVVIYADVNLNGQFDQGEPSTVSMPDDLLTQFDETGLYWLNDLPAGNYILQEVVPDGFRQTFPPAGAHLISLSTGENIDGIDFGNAVEP